MYSLDAVRQALRSWRQESPSHGSSERAAFLLVALAGLGLGIYFMGFILDDPFVSFRYARIGSFGDRSGKYG